MRFRPRGDNWTVPRLLVALAIFAALVGGCGADVFKAPPPTAGDFTDIASALARRGMTITTQVAGDSGCGTTNASLHNNAVRYDVRLANEAVAHPVFVFGWKSQQTFDNDAATFQECAASYAASSGEHVDTIEHLPWRAYGPAWPDALKAAVDTALTEAGGMPAPVEPE
jgi:hypothetical protein